MLSSTRDLLKQDIKDLIEILPAATDIQKSANFIIAFESNRNLQITLEKFKRELGIETIRRLPDKDGETYIFIKIQNLEIYAKFLQQSISLESDRESANTPTTNLSTSPISIFLQLIKKRNYSDAVDLLAADNVLQASISNLEFNDAKNLLINVIDYSHLGNEYFLHNLLKYLPEKSRILQSLLPSYANDNSLKEINLTKLFTNHLNYPALFIPPITNYLESLRDYPSPIISIEMLLDPNLSAAIKNLNLENSKQLLLLAITSINTRGTKYIKKLVEHFNDENKVAVIDFVFKKLKNNVSGIHKRKIIFLQEYLEKISVNQLILQIKENKKRPAEVNESLPIQKKFCNTSSSTLQTPLAFFSSEKQNINLNQLNKDINLFLAEDNVESRNNLSSSLVKN